MAVISVTERVPGRMAFGVVVLALFLLACCCGSVSTPRSDDSIRLPRRRLLGSAVGLSALAFAAACGADKVDPVGNRPGDSSPGNGGMQFAALETTLTDLERDAEVRLGVFAHDLVSGATYSRRDDERFAMCSTFKVYAVAAILRLRSEGGISLDAPVPIDPADIVSHSPVTGPAKGRTLTVGELCQATLVTSDNTAANLLLHQLGGPPAITEFSNSVGDPATLLDRWEPDLSSAEPGDIRDTTTPSGMGPGWEELLLGGALSDEDRTTLLDWMRGSITSDEQIRAGLPPEWTAADKTGSGSYGTVNDCGVVWSPEGAPLLLLLFSSSTVPDDSEIEGNKAVIADATAAVVSAVSAMTG